MVRTPSRRVLKITAVIVLIPALALAAFLIRYYYIFDGIIEQKLGKRYNVADTEIYSAPVTLYPGKRVRMQELLAKLRRLGYAERAAKASKVSSYETVKDNRILVFNDAKTPEDSNRLVEVTCSNTAIRSIVDTASKNSLPKFMLKPELLSNIINKNREKRRFVNYRDLPKALIPCSLQMIAAFLTTAASIPSGL